LATGKGEGQEGWGEVVPSLFWIKVREKKIRFPEGSQASAGGRGHIGGLRREKESAARKFYWVGGRGIVENVREGDGPIYACDEAAERDQVDGKETRKREDTQETGTQPYSGRSRKKEGGDFDFTRAS